MVPLKLDGLHIATSINFHPNFEEEKTLIEFKAENGQQIGVELRGGLTAFLKAQIGAGVSAHPEILAWEGYTPRSH